MTDATLVPPAATGLTVFDLREVPAAGETGAGFLGQRLAVSRHPGWDFWRASGAERAGTHEIGGWHLVVLLLEGTLGLRGRGLEVSLAAGDIALIAPGVRFDWTAGPGARWIVNGRAGTASATFTPAIARIDREAPQEPSAPPAADLLLGPVPSCTKRTVAASGDGSWSAGLWSATPFERRPVRYGYYELMQLHDGAVTVFDAAGHERTFGPGAVFLMPEGTTAGWRSTVPVRKFWSILTPE
ncbi:cupin domain-containing protein [Cereibacter johrii]|uniref:cupin domain-containing protein n=1 Tax=Cereibacter johrii TaxID=445629 RepID=UPI000DCDAB86|nr:cupin domain-containing protein [Cereibacter johrii]RAZ86483.1 enzyme of the cupin superfamily [Cereibacter johrii]